MSVRYNNTLLVTMLYSTGTRFVSCVVPMQGHLKIRGQSSRERLDARNVLSIQLLKDAQVETFKGRMRIQSGLVLLSWSA